MIRKFLLLLIGGGFLYASYLSTLGENDLPPLKDGDLVFQTTWTNQSLAVGVATGSLYLHTGIIKQTDKGPVVIHAAQQVVEEPLHDWIKGGILQRFAVYRHKGLGAEQSKRIVEKAEAYLGRRYDFHFLFGNQEIYCSELPYLSYKDSGITLGKAEKVGELSINNRFVKKLIEQRWQDHPKCEGKNMNFEQCYDIIMSQELISPAALAEDKNMERLFSNYP